MAEFTNEPRVKLIVWTYVLAWVGMSIFNFGTINAQVRWDMNHRYADLHEHRRDAIGFIVFESCAAAPVELLSSVMITNFLQHGWTLDNW